MVNIGAAGPVAGRGTREMPVNTARIESLVRELLLEIGEDPEREGLVKTPQRVAAA